MPGGTADIRCLVADDHPAIMDAVCRFLDEEDGIEVVGRARDGEEALRLIGESRPAVALLDIRMPLLDGIEVARKLGENGSETAVVLYTGHGDQALLMEALEAGAKGFLLKEAPLDDLLRALRIVADGGTFVDPVLGIVLDGPGAARPLADLTAREREILGMLADGMRNEEVGLRLSISPLTVRTHVTNAMRKLNADTRTEAVASALRRQLIA